MNDVRHFSSNRLSKHRVPLPAVIVMLTVFCTCGDWTKQVSALQFAMAQNNRIQVDENQLDSWIFNNRGSADAARRELEAILQTRVDLIALANELTPEQRQKLELAGAGDIHRFFNEYKTLRRSLPTGSISQQEYQDLWQKIQPFQQKYHAGLFSRNSLMAKSVRYVLQENQISRYEQFERERQQRHYESVLRGTIAMMEDELPLTVAQREKLFDILLAQKVSIRSLQNSYYQMYAVMYQMGKIPEEDLKPIFLENEWVIMKAFFQRAKGYEQMLRQQGFFD